MGSDITSGTDYEASPGQAFGSVWIASSAVHTLLVGTASVLSIVHSVAGLDSGPRAPALPPHTFRFALRWSKVLSCGVLA